LEQVEVALTPLADVGRVDARAEFAPELAVALQAGWAVADS